MRRITTLTDYDCTCDYSCNSNSKNKGKSRINSRHMMIIMIMHFPDLHICWNLDTSGRPSRGNSTTNGRSARRVEFEKRPASPHLMPPVPPHTNTNEQRRHLVDNSMGSAGNPRKLGWSNLFVSADKQGVGTKKLDITFGDPSPCNDHSPSLDNSQDCPTTQR